MTALLAFRILASAFFLLLGAGFLVAMCVARATDKEKRMNNEYYETE